jgi:signal transduction histidine kinase
VSAAGTLLGAEAQPNVLIQEADVDGQAVRFPALPLAAAEPRENTRLAPAASLRLSSHAQTLGFLFGLRPGAPNAAVRLRYQLKGVDNQWREAAGEMRLNVKLLDAGNNIVAAQDFNASGESVGWAGTVARSRFVRRHEELTVPTRAAWLQIELFSGGSEPTVGVLAIDDLTLAVTGTTNQPPTQLFSSKSTQWKAEDAENSLPEGWARDGSLSSIARMASTGEAKPRYVLMVADNDPKRWGAWRMDRLTPVTPGQSLILEWSEMFSVGWGAEAWARYSRLPPGQYLFQARAATETGEWAGGEASVALAVVPPLWQRTWFRLTLLGSAMVLLLAAVRYATWRRMQTRLEETERQRAVEHERTRIARDIHDDLGANLTQIALLSELAQTDMDDPGQAKTHLRQIFSAARSMTRQLDEIVWAVDPENDSLEATVNYLCKFAQDYLRLAGVRCRLEAPETSPRLTISSAQRHNLFLVVKEALNNIVKHAQAAEVWLRIQQDAAALVLVIEDNGTGFVEQAHAQALPTGTGGHGIQNMQRRMTRIGARFEQRSEPGKGTVVRLTLPLSGR